MAATLDDSPGILPGLFVSYMQLFQRICIKVIVSRSRDILKKPDFGCEWRARVRGPPLTPKIGNSSNFCEALIVIDRLDSGLMLPATFFEKLKQNPRPVVVDLWAPWCGPCRMVKPILEKLAAEYHDRVDLWQLNADQNQEILRELNVSAIPTLIVYRGGNEVARYIGAKPAAELKALFETLSTGGDPSPAGLALGDRLIRLGLGIAMAALGWTWNSGTNWILLVIGGLLLFSAVYDRCPIWKALVAQFKKNTAK